MPLRMVREVAKRGETEQEEALVKFPSSMKDYQHKTSWHNDDANLFALVAAENVHEAIGRSTSCVVARHAYHNVLYIASSDYSNCKVAVDRLDNICKYAVGSPQSSNLI